jgi:hypothetical protein
MSSQKYNNPSLKKIYNNTLSFLKHHKVIFIPFLIFTFIELVILFLFYLSPRMPFIVVLGPPIKAFFGEKFLHYPYNFVLLPKLEGLSRNILSVIVGSLMTAMAVSIIGNAYYKKSIKLINVFKVSLRRYFALFFIVLIISLFIYGALKVSAWGLVRYFTAGHKTLLFMKPALWLGPILTGIGVLISIIIQACFVYAIPLLMINKEKTFKALVQSVVIFFRFFLPTLILVAIPMLAYVPIIILQYNTLFIIDKFFPELVLFFSCLGVLIISLFVDVLITVSVTLFYLHHKDSLEKA